MALKYTLAFFVPEALRVRAILLLTEISKSFMQLLIHLSSAYRFTCPGENQIQYNPKSCAIHRSIR